MVVEKKIETGEKTEKKGNKKQEKKGQKDKEDIIM